MSTAYDRRLRRILMKSRKIDINQLDSFDEQLRDSDKNLSSLVLESGIITELELISLMAMATDIPPIDLTRFKPDADLCAKLDKASAIKYVAFPVGYVGDILTVALADPFEHSIIENLEIVTKCKIHPVLSTEALILRTIENKYIKPAKEEEPVDNTQVEQAINAAVSADFEEIIDETIDGKSGGEEEEEYADEADKGIIRLVNKVIIDAFKKGVSDIHIEPYHGKANTIIRFRQDGECYVYQEVPNQVKRAMLSRLKIMSGLDIAERRLPQDGKIQFKKYVRNLNIELRVATIPTVGGNEDAVLRILAASEPLPIEKMGFAERNLREFQRIVQYPYGLILVVGPTGSGKTTTLHSALGFINEPKRKIWTAEDPVEITQRGLRQVQVQAKIGFDFARAMRAFLRADPDVIMVGEMRDHETAAMGIEASLTGHLVLSTLHTNSAPETVVRLIDMGLDPFNFADALLGIIAQRLCRRLCGCKKEEVLTIEEYDELVDDFGRGDWKGPEYEEGMMMIKKKGCDKCEGKGYKGRLGIHEMLVATDEMKGFIQRKAKVEEIRVQAVADGMNTLKQDGILKAMEGITDLQAVRAVCIK